MAGHSHWAGIKHKKALVDAKRGKQWSKISKQIIVAARMGGGDPETNGRLRLAIADAKSARMPKDNIERAVKKGTGELAGGEVEEVIYEGYGPDGVAVMCDILTDNRNRTAPEVRKIFDLCGGNLGATGCVAWMFDRKGLFLVPAAGREEDELMELALENGADDVRRDGVNYEITCSVDAYGSLRDALENAGIEPEVAKIDRIPNTTVDLDVDSARRVLRLMDMLDEQDDVDNVSANFNISDDVMAAIEAETAA